MNSAPQCGHWVRGSHDDVVLTPVLGCATCAAIVHARVLAADDPLEQPIELTPPCTACGEPVDVRQPHVQLLNVMQTRTKSTTRTHARRVLGTWHKACARTWPVPLQRHAPTEEDDHG